jgi:CarD family transcriptional regulator
MMNKLEFTAGDFVVYPAHGVGRVEGIETHHIAGQTVTLYAITFEKERMTLKVPVGKAKDSGLRRLSSKDRIKVALETLQGRSRARRAMWSRRAQEYEAKINSGDLIAVAEVVRDLYRSEAQPEQSYSERQLYEAALDRVVREISAVNKITDTEALKLIEQSLAKSPRRTKGTEEVEEVQEEAA